jgi:hypothetical protein
MEINMNHWTNERKAAAALQMEVRRWQAILDRYLERAENGQNVSNRIRFILAKIAAVSKIRPVELAKWSK